MKISVLGPLEVIHDDVPVTIRRARCRAVLAFLVSRHPERVRVEMLADALWPDADDGEKATNSARVHVHHLRRALPGHEAVLPAGDGGYGLRISHAELDVVRFAEAAAQGRELSTAGQPAEALAQYERALGEWRGDAYTDFAGIHAFDAVRARLADERFDVVHGYCRALLDHDGADEVVRLLPEIVAEHPGREDLGACLMVGYFRTGRQSDALGLFGRIKDDLAERGLQPGDGLTKIAEAIVVEPETLARGRPAILPRRATRPRARGAVVGREDERQ